METRICKVCGAEHPLTIEYWAKNTDSKDGFRQPCRACYREKRRRYYEANKEKLVAKSRNYYQENKSVLLETSTEYRRHHKDRAKYYRNRRRRERLDTDPVFYWTHRARCAVRRAVNANSGKNYTASPFLEELTGLSLLHLHNYLLQTYEDIYGYPWDGVEKAEVDHIVPLCTEKTIDGRQKLFHYTNLRLIKEADNKAKRASLDYKIGGNSKC